MKSIRRVFGAFITLSAILHARDLPAAEANAAAALRLKLPLDYQVHQRATRTEGRIIVAGSFPKGSEHPGTLEARLVGAGASEDWRKLADVQSGTTEFRAELNGPSGGWYRLEVCLRHIPDDPGSPEIRAAQQALWKSGIALEGPDSDAMTGDLRDGGGQGVHFSGKGLREHGARWAGKVSPWLEQQLANASQPAVPAKPKATGAPPKLLLPITEDFTVEGRPAFVFLPPVAKRANPQPWVLYAPTLPAYPDEAERWMHEQFHAAGVAVAGVDVGEAYGSPKSHAWFDALYRELTAKRGFATKPCLFGRSRGGLWVSSWAIANPGRVAGIIGIYPVFDFRTYPGLKNAAPAYGLTPAELEARADEFNPIARIEALARAGVPAALIHGDVDKVVPLKENSAEFVRRYQKAGAESLVKLIVLEGQGHSFFEGFFHSQALVDFAIVRARAGARP